MEPGIPIESLQDVGSEPDQVNPDCLSVPLILREILQYFTSTELLQLSFVNKQWRYEARSLMRTRGNIIASINKNQTCQDLRAFASDLRWMREITKVVPFSGMKISVGGTSSGNNDYCQQSPNGELEPVYEEIVDGLTWKYLSLRHLIGWDQHKSCLGFILGKKILRKVGSVLEELSVELEWSRRNGGEAAKYFKEEFLQECKFSHLKTFRLLNEERSVESEWSALIKTVVSTAPHLQLLYTKSCVNLKSNLLEGSSAVLVAGASYMTSRDEIPENVAHQIQVHGMDLLSFGYVFSLERFNRITSAVLQSSHEILSSMYINVIFLAPLIRYGIRLENVTRFRLALDAIQLEETQPPILRIAQSFDFTRTFPKLDALTILFTHHYSIPAEFKEMIEQVNATLQPPSPDRAANIKHLNLSHLHKVLQRRSSLSLLAHMFPNVQKLSIQDPNIALADIRDIWVDLREVDFTLWCALHTLRNHDSVFCGIFPEEVDLLREQDEEYLRRVNIVPVMPTIAYLKELRNFKVSYQKMRFSYTGPTDDPTCLFSKVTSLIAFQRYPNLTVTLTSEDERLAEALGHLRPYASVLYEKCTRSSTRTV